MLPVNHLLIQNLFMDKFSYAIGLGIGQNLLSMGARSIDVNDFDTGYQRRIGRNQTAILTMKHVKSSTNISLN